MTTQPTPQHQWLKRFLGQWSYVSHVASGPGHEPEEFKGKETFRAIGDLWVQGEGTGDMPGGGTATTILTIGYDPQKAQFVGSWIGSMMAYLWVYEGRLDADGKTLLLDSTGPDCMTEGQTARYQERITFNDTGTERLFTSNLIDEDGTATELARVVYTKIA